MLVTQPKFSHFLPIFLLPMIRYVYRIQVGTAKHNAKMAISVQLVGEFLLIF